MRQFILFCCLCAGTLQGFSQNSYTENAAAYISKYKDVAIEEQHRTGIPAAIKLAQGLFESGAGTSELCHQANNHFGIKCKNTWQGATYAYTDDAKDECFRKYEDDLQSFKDHSDFLKQNKRYQSLFDLSATDYAAWAYGLKKCGYATDPQYAKKLIKTIEELHLQEYTYLAMETPAQKDEVLLASSDPYVPAATYSELQEQSADRMVATAPETVAVTEETPADVAYYELTTREGKKGFYAKKGDMLLEAAIKNRIRYARLLELNDLQDRPLESDRFVYLEKRAKPGLLSKAKDNLMPVAFSDEDRALPGLMTTKAKATSPTRAATPPEVQEIAVVQEAAQEPVAEAPDVVRETETMAEVNIAQEPAIEEVMRSEQETYVAATEEEEFTDNTETAGEATVTTPATAQSPLDKLKTYMDQTVYKEKQQATAPVGTASPTAEDNYTATVPARQLAQANKSNNNNPANRVAASPAQQEKTTFHTVVRGDTAFSISKKYNISISQLQQWNRLSSTTIPLGKRLRVAAP